MTSLFREYGYRRSRNQSRLKFLVKDWGAEEFRRVLEKEFLDAPLPDGPAPPPVPPWRATISASVHSGTAAPPWGSRHAPGA